jgi:hypothetical protein
MTTFTLTDEQYDTLYVAIHRASKEGGEPKTIAENAIEYFISLRTAEKIRKGYLQRGSEEVEK